MNHLALRSNSICYNITNMLVFDNIGSNQGDDDANLEYSMVVNSFCIIIIITNSIAIVLQNWCCHATCWLYKCFKCENFANNNKTNMKWKRGWCPIGIKVKKHYLGQQTEISVWPIKQSSSNDLIWYEMTTTSPLLTIHCHIFQSI